MPDPDPSPDSDALPWRDRVELLTQRQEVTPQRIAGGAALIILALAAAWFFLRTPAAPPLEAMLPIAGSVGDPAASTTTTADAFVIAHAAGAVVHPGVYKLAAGARVTDLIDAAGGPAPDADVDRLNLAAVVVDGQRVYVPRVGEVVTAADSVIGTDQPAGPLNLNIATLAQLEALPGVGPATAKAIIDERERRGGFGSVDDLLDVRGIGPAKLDAIRDLVTV